MAFPKQIRTKNPFLCLIAAVGMLTTSIAEAKLASWGRYHIYVLSQLFEYQQVTQHSLERKDETSDEKLSSKEALELYERSLVGSHTLQSWNLLPVSFADLDQLRKLHKERLPKAVSQKLSFRIKDPKPLPPCPLVEKLPQLYEEHMTALSPTKEPSKDPSYAMEFVKGWRLDKVQCLVFQLYRNFLDEKHPNKASDPLPLLSGLSTLHQQFRSDSGINLIYAARLLIDQQYAEALRTIYQLRSSVDDLDETYASVQRAFNYYQKGKGEVALRP